MDVFEKGLITIIGAVFVFALLAIPLMLRKVPRNVIYGFRTRATLSSDEMWYDANAHFGRGMLAASIVSMFGIVALYSLKLDPRVFLNASVAVLMIPLAIATLRTFRYIRTR